MSRKFEIFFDDLKPETQERLSKFLGGENGNYDAFPIATLEIEDDENKGNEES